MTAEEMIEKTAQQLHERTRFARRFIAIFNGLIVCGAVILMYMHDARNISEIIEALFFLLIIILIIWLTSESSYRRRLFRRLNKFGPCAEILAELNEAEEHVFHDKEGNMHHVRFGPRCTICFPTIYERGLVIPPQGKILLSNELETFIVHNDTFNLTFSGAEAFRLFAQHYEVEGGNPDPESLWPLNSPEPLWTKLLTDAKASAVREAVCCATDEPDFFTGERLEQFGEKEVDLNKLKALLNTCKTQCPDKKEKAESIEAILSVLNKMETDPSFKLRGKVARCLSILFSACTEAPRLTDTDMLLRVAEEQVPLSKEEKMQLERIPFAIGNELDLKIRENLLQAAKASGATEEKKE